MNTMTFVLSNGKSITMAYEGTNPTTFLQTVIEKGETLDLEMIAKVEVIGFTCSFTFAEKDKIHN
jgi:hypothetical protein